MLRKVTTFLLVMSLVVSMLATVGVKSQAALITTPTEVKGVTYTYSDNVKFKDLSGISRVGDNIKIEGSTFSAGDIIVDETHQTSLKVLKVNPDGTLMTAQPTMTELFKSFDIPRQVIEPSAGNITEYAVKGISLEDYAKKLATEPQETQKFMSGNMSPLMDKIDTIFEQRGSKIYSYDGVYEFKSSSGSKVNLALDGSVGISPGIVADYSLFGGYEFGFVDAAQFVKLDMMFDVKINEELYLPIYAITVPIPKLGSVKLGIYLVVDVDGDITLTVRAQEGIIANASVYGGTSFGIPTSFHVNQGLEQYFGAECDPMGIISAGLYITPLVNLEILDCDVFGAQLRLGFLGHANVTESTMNYGVDFVVNAFVTILDDRTNLINITIPIIERNKSFRIQDDVTFYFSRLCAFQDRINIAAMTKKMSGGSPSSDPFSDKQPFANRDLMVWYYKAGNDPQGGANQNPTYKILAKTDQNGCVGVDFMALKGIDVQKGDIIKITAPGFIGETDLLKSVSPFGPEKLPGQSDFYGPSSIQGDFFEEKVTFNGMSGTDLTELDVPNTLIIEFEPKGRIHYDGTVKVFSTDINTKVTETAVFTAQEGITEYTLQKQGIYSSAFLNQNQYNIKPFNEMRWQINADGFIYGTYEATGAGGKETNHQITVKRVVEDQQVPIEDYNGNTIGIQHNVSLHIVAVNKGGTKPFNTTANVYYAFGDVPADYIQTYEKDKCLLETPYVKFPAANIRYPNHYEYYNWQPFPELLYENNVTNLAINSANNVSTTPDNSEMATVTSGNLLWRWEEIKPDIPSTISVEKSHVTIGVTGAPVTVKYSESVPNIIYKVPSGTDISQFANIPIAYTEYTTAAGVSLIPPELLDETTLKLKDMFQMRHIVSGLSIEGVPIENPSFSPPQPMVKGDFFSDLTPSDPNAFDIEFQFELMKEHSDRFVVSPLDEDTMEKYSVPGAVLPNTSVKAGVFIRNASSIPQWAKGYVAAVINNKIMFLDGKGNFPTGKPTTRADFCAAIVNALGLSAVDTTKTGFPFTDVSSKDVNLSKMKIAYQCGIIDGITGIKFSPTTLITRQEAATMLMRAFRLRNEGLIPENTDGSLDQFTDDASISAYAIKNFEQAVALNFFGGNGKGGIIPLNNITNEQTAKIVWELKLKALLPGRQWESIK